MTKTDYNFLHRLYKGEKISCSNIPETVKKRTYFENLLKSKVILLDGTWMRGSIKLNEQEQEYFKNYFKEQFPEITQHNNRSANIKMFRNSKAKDTKSNAIVFLKGNIPILLNQNEVDLNFYTTNFDFFSTSLKDKKLVCEKLCFVENLYSFLNVEKVIDSEKTVFLHSYGRVGQTLLNQIEATEVLVFSDYDFVGLDEYLKFKNAFENVSFFMPKNYDMLFNKYARKLKSNGKSTTQKPSEQVRKSQDEVVTKIRNQVFENQKFLEQEILIP